MKTNLKVSVIIPSHNRLTSIVKTIDSVLKQKYDNFEIIIVDDSSTDGTPNILEKKFGDKLIIICSEKRGGPSIARNIGISKACGEFVWFLDSDVLLQDQWLMEKMVSTLNKNSHIGSLGGEIVAHESYSDRAYGRKLLWNCNNKRMVAYKKDSLIECDYLATCNCFTRKVFVDKVEGFDEKFIFGAEDTDFGTKLKSLGLKNYVSYELAVHHFHEKSGRFENETIRYQYTRIQFAKKHFCKIRVSVMFFYDSCFFSFFYLMLLPKLSLMFLQKKKIGKQNLLGGWNNIRCYFKAKPF